MKSHSSTKSRKRKKGRLKVSRRGDRDVVLKDEVQRCLDKKYKDLVEYTYGSEFEDDSYWTWFDALHSIGYGAVTTTLLNMKIMFPEHVSYDKYLSTKERVGVDAMMEGVSLTMCLTHEVLDQLVAGIFITYATNKELDLPPNVVQRCQLGKRV